MKLDECTRWENGANPNDNEPKAHHRNLLRAIYL